MFAPLNFWIGLGGLVFLFSCRISAPEEGAYFSFQSIDSLSAYDSLSVLLKDTDGKFLESLFEGKPDSLKALAKVHTLSYQGGKATLEVRGFTGGKLVYVKQIYYDGEGGKTDPPRLLLLPSAHVALEEKNIFLHKGDTAALPKVIVTPDTLSQALLLWSTSDSLSVRLGETSLSAVDSGFAWIVVRLAADTSRRDSVKVVVGPVIPTRISLQPRSLRLFRIGDTAWLSASFFPAAASDRRIGWSAGGGHAVSVKPEGLVTAESFGTGWIKVQSLAAPAVFDSVPVRVAPTPRQLTLEQDTLTLFAGGTGVDLRAEISPAGADQGFSLVSRNPAVILSSGRTISPASPGQAWVVAFSAEDPSVRDSLLINVREPSPIPSLSLRAGPDTLVRVGDTVRFLVQVAQASGGIALFRWDAEGKGEWDSTAPELRPVAHVYARAGVYWARFSVRDSGYRDTTVTRRIQAVGMPEVEILSPKDKQSTRLKTIPVLWKANGEDRTDTEVLHDGENTVTRRAGNILGDSAGISVKVYLDTLPPDPPQVAISFPGSRALPRWSWKSRGGAGRFRFHAETDDMSAAEETSDTSYTPAAPLADGPHVIFVQERDEAGNWSASGSAAAAIDATPPAPPSVVAVTASPTLTLRPTWKWSGGGGGIHIFRVKLNDSILETGARTVTDTTYAAESDLTDGPQILYVQERDSAGNWSQAGHASVNIDLTPPNPPILSLDPESPTNNTRPTWSWISGGGGGSGTFRFRLDSNDIATKGIVTTGGNLTPSALTEGTHVLYVQERDSLGNWSQVASKPVKIDLTPPKPPVVTYEYSPQSQALPVWSWSGGGGGRGIFKYSLYSYPAGWVFSGSEPSAPSVGAVPTSDLSYAPSAPLPAGTHRFFTEEVDSAGNWSFPTLSTVLISSDATIDTLFGYPCSIHKSSAGGGPNTTLYSAGMNVITGTPCNDNTPMSITIVVHEPHASISVAGVPVASGQASPQVRSRNGSIDATVTAQDGVTKRMHSIQTF